MLGIRGGTYSNRKRLELWLNRADQIHDFLGFLENHEVFDEMQFAKIRRFCGSQAEWATKIGVTAATVGNWERGVTYPNPNYRKKIARACREFLADIERQYGRVKIGKQLSLDYLAARKGLKDSVLKAALTDFDFDEEQGKIVAIPFEHDTHESNIEQIERDKRDLIDSLSQQAETILEGIRSSNLSSEGLSRYLKKYRDECRKETPNPRILYRFGNTIQNKTNDEDIILSVSGWDQEAIDGFNSDHKELLRLHFRAALARMQEAEALALNESADEASADLFSGAADQIEQVKDKNGRNIFDEDVPVLLRDIGREVENLDEAQQFIFDQGRKSILRKRRREAIVNGSLFIGRLIFFSSLFVALTPAAALSTLGSLASLIGLIEIAAPGSIRARYEKLRESLQMLPKLPTEVDDDKKD